MTQVIVNVLECGWWRTIFRTNTPSVTRVSHTITPPHDSSSQVFSGGKKKKKKKTSIDQSEFVFDSSKINRILLFKGELNREKESVCVCVWLKYFVCIEFTYSSFKYSLSLSHKRTTTQIVLVSLAGTQVTPPQAQAQQLERGDYKIVVTKPTELDLR